MNCNEARQWFTAQLDGELDLGRDAEVTAHVQGCTDCAARWQQQKHWRETLREKLPRWSPPAHLATRIRAELQAADAGIGMGQDAAPTQRKLRWFSPTWLGATAGLAAALAMAFLGGERHERATRLAEELVSAHQLAVTRGQLTDVLSSDRHTVKPWLSQHLDFSPPVSDFAAEGFPLIGGRIDRLQGHAVAALVYQRHKHTITVYVSPSATVIFPAAALRGYHVRSWRDGDLSFAAVSDVGVGEFDEFVARCRAELR